MFKSIKSISSTRVAKIAYHAILESHGLRVWGKSSVTNLQHVLVHQKKAIRVLAELNNRDSCSHLRKHFTATERYSDRCKYNTRQALNFTLLTIFEENPFYLEPKFLNLLPEPKEKGLVAESGSGAEVGNTGEMGVVLGEYKKYHKIYHVFLRVEMDFAAIVKQIDGISLANWKVVGDVHTDSFRMMVILVDIYR
ncbi:hypothetical protein J6590_015478 [Homalodisca vitripennis]|nr:hypothetical protein J6590_100367 [Homalodisca vitripennis]KAG8337810.1 hypothetical protein J6590_015478 [Homalodisca vitripennis]